MCKTWISRSINNKYLSFKSRKRNIWLLSMIDNKLFTFSLYVFYSKFIIIYIIILSGMWIINILRMYGLDDMRTHMLTKLRHWLSTHVGCFDVGYWCAYKAGVDRVKSHLRDKPARLNARLFFLLEIILFVTAFFCGWGGWNVPRRSCKYAQLNFAPPALIPKHQTDSPIIQALSTTSTFFKSSNPIKMADKLFELTQEDVQLLLAAEAHLGAKNVQVSKPLSVFRYNQ